MKPYGILRFSATGRLFAAAAVLLTLFTLAAGYAQAKGANPMVKLETNLGDITIELDAEKAPETVANFLGYVKDGFYNGTIFHRVINGFMIQGGGMTADMKEKQTKIAHQKRSGQWAQKRDLHHGHGPHPGPPQRQLRSFSSTWRTTTF